MYAVINLLCVRLLITLALMLTGCSSFLCGNDILQEVVSPDGKFVATVFERNCGATTPYLRIVNLRLANTPFDAEASDDWIFKINGQPKVQISWSDIDNLSISYTGSGETPTLIYSWKQVKVNYPY